MGTCGPLIAYRRGVQTFYALLALSVFGLLALNVQRRSAHVEGRSLGNELETVALGVAADRLNRAALLPFDRAGLVSDVDQLTSPDAFGGAQSWDRALDLDDLDGLADSVAVGEGDGALGLEVRAAVRYVARAGGPLSGGAFVPSPTPTPYKELVVEVHGDLEKSVSLSRVFGCRFRGETRGAPPAL